MCGSKKMAKTTKRTNPKLWEASASHAADMKNKDYFSHKNWVGPETRLINVGYLKNVKSTYAENIAAGPSSKKKYLTHGWPQKTTVQTL